MNIHYPVLTNQMQAFDIEYGSLGEPSCALISYVLDGQTYVSSTIGTSQLTCATFYPGIFYSGVYATSLKNGVNVLTFQMYMAFIGFMTIYANFADSMSASTRISTSFNVVKTPFQCGDPILGIEQRAALFHAPSVYKRSDLFSVKGTISITCNTSLSNAKQWRIFKVNATTGIAEQEITIKAHENPTVNYAELVMQPNSLEYGLYRIVFKMTMTYTNNLIFTDQVDTYVSVVPSGLVVSALSASQLSSGGGTLEITRGVKQTVEFNPFLNSYDLDSLVSVFSLQFKYYCHIMRYGVQFDYPELYVNEKVDLNMFKLNPSLRSSMMSNASCFDSPGNFLFLFYSVN